MKTKEVIFIIILLFGFHKGFAQEREYPFANDIRKFKVSDSISPPPRNAILFFGSSSFTLWKDVQNYFPGFTIINRGFGGSSLPDLIRYAGDIVFPCNPKQVVIYCGENDFASSDTLTPTEVTSRFIQLFDRIRLKMPGVRVTYVSMKPSPSRWHLAGKFVAANRSIRKFLNKQHNTGYVDVWHKMLEKKKQPLTGIYLPDQLHMNSKGYEIWKKAITPYLIK
jgi:lysophospholipase L1-like esterase